MLPFTIHQLKIFKALAKEKNFSKAARLLYISQPSFSRQMTKLEKNLNIALINKTKNKISLTENGQIFLQYSERILALCEESCRALIDISNAYRGNLKIGSSQTIGIYVMPKILALFKKNYPQFKLKIQINSTHTIIKNIINREIDIAIISNKISKELKKKIKTEHFAADELNLVISKLHPFAQKTKIQKKDLYKLRFITLNSNSTIKNFIDYTLQCNGIDINQLKIIMQLNSIEGIKTAVSLGLGAAFISSSAIEKEIKLETIKIIEINNIKITRAVSIITNNEYYKSKSFQLFYTQLYLLKTNSNNIVLS